MSNQRHIPDSNDEAVRRIVDTAISSPKFPNASAIRHTAGKRRRRASARWSRLSEVWHGVNRCAGSNREQSPRAHVKRTTENWSAN